jgi:hypothetical protein
VAVEGSGVGSERAVRLTWEGELLALAEPRDGVLKPVTVLST